MLLQRPEEAGCPQEPPGGKPGCLKELSVCVVLYVTQAGRELRILLPQPPGMHDEMMVGGYLASRYTRGMKTTLLLPCLGCLC